MDPFKGITTIIMAGGKGERLSPLTRDRAKPAITFGGIYRIIDFTLSNCLNSGIRRIYVLTQYGGFSLDQHLRLAWDIMHPELGEFIYSMAPQQIMVNRWYRGTADSIYQNLKLLQEERPRHVLILSGDHVYKMNYLEMLNFHLTREADMTVAAVMVPRREGSSLGILEVDADSQVVGFLEKPKNPPGLPGNPDYTLASMGVYLFRAEVLVQEVIKDAKRKDSKHDFGQDIIPQMVGRKKVFAFNFQHPVAGTPQYWRDIGRLDAYFAAHLDLLGDEPVFRLFDEDWPIRGHLTFSPPARYISRRKPVTVTDALISAGCILEEATVRRSVLSPKVMIAAGAEVEEAILWDGVLIGAGAKVKRAVIEDGVHVPPGYTIGWDPKADALRFPVTEGGIVVVPNNVILEE
ncbi:MAG: glucose-1-phosphate adenylyltransferase [Deltaproteobacteria bacterium RBG_13_58_19]|nr:MAG: glucose-1-phosphate adenylyltransferase [Deltaproteobacteria bacterium RBG_13_58_19]